MSNNNSDDTQWETTYNDDHLRILREEEDNASVGEQGHDGCFPKSEVWTVWVNRLNRRGFLVHFHDLNEAYIYATAFLNSTKTPVMTVSTRGCLEVHNTVKSNKLLYIGKCESLQTAIFRGNTPTTELTALCTNKLYQIRPSYAIILGAEGEPEDQVENKKPALIVKVQISKYDLQDWNSYI